MALINFEDLVVGMKVTDAVKDQAGRMVMSAGSEITQKHLRIFKMWGITQVEVDADAENVELYGSLAVDQGLIDDCDAEARLLFRHTDLDNAVVAQLFKLVVQRKVRQKSTEQKKSG